MAVCIVNSPHVLYRSERLTDEALYARLEPEALQAAMGYLTTFDSANRPGGMNP